VNALPCIGLLLFGGPDMHVTDVVSEIQWAWDGLICRTEENL
jgi:hypothetical protein